MDQQGPTRTNRHQKIEQKGTKKAQKRKKLEQMEQMEQKRTKREPKGIKKEKH